MPPRRSPDFTPGSLALLSTQTQKYLHPGSSAIEPANGVGHILVGYNPEDFARDHRVSPVTPRGKTKRTEETCWALITAGHRTPKAGRHRSGRCYYAINK